MDRVSVWVSDEPGLKPRLLCRLLADNLEEVVLLLLTLYLLSLKKGIVGEKQAEGWTAGNRLDTQQMVVIMLSVCKQRIPTLQASH